MGWVRAHLSFAVLWAVLLCVRGSCTKWRSLGIVDGASFFQSMLLINPFVLSVIFCVLCVLCGVTLSLFCFDNNYTNNNNRVLIPVGGYLWWMQLMPLTH